MESEKGKERNRITWKQFFNWYSLGYLVSGAILSSLFMLLPMAIQEWKFSGFIDGTFLGGAMAVGIGLLFWAGNEGTFDIISLGFSDLVSTIKRNGERKYKGLYEYREDKKVLRKSRMFSWLAFELVGLIFILISIISYFIYF